MTKHLGPFTSILGLVALLIAGCTSTRSLKRINLSEGPDLAPADGGDSRLVWKKAPGTIDCTVFYGDLKGSKRSGVGIYWGSYPSFKQSGTPEPGKLGVFDVQWYPAPQPELWEKPKGQSNCLVTLQQIRGTLGGRAFTNANQRHVWAYANTEGELRTCIAELNRIKMFSQRLPDRNLGEVLKERLNQTNSTSQVP